MVGKRAALGHIEMTWEADLKMESLSSLVSMLRPRAVHTKLITGSGRWGARYGRIETTGFGLVLAGDCHLSVGGPHIRLQKGDFVLMPPCPEFSISSDPNAECVPFVAQSIEEAPVPRHHGRPDTDPEFKLLGGYFWFDQTNASLLPHLLPELLCVRNADVHSQRLLATIELLVDEATNQRPGRDLIVSRLVEIMLVEALRLAGEEPGIRPLPGLLQGMSDPHIAAALRCIHADAANQWTVADLARRAGLSRSVFSDRFARKVGIPPMEYVLRWRIALAKDMLRRDLVPLEKVAVRLGYQSASAFSTAFSREVGQPPSQFARAASREAV